MILLSLLMLVYICYRRIDERWSNPIFAARWTKDPDKLWSMRRYGWKVAQEICDNPHTPVNLLHYMALYYSNSSVNAMAMDRLPWTEWTEVYYPWGMTYTKIRMLP